MQLVFADHLALFISLFYRKALKTLSSPCLRASQKMWRARNRPGSAFSTCLQPLFLKVVYDSSCRHGSFHLSLPANSYQNFYLFILIWKKKSLQERKAEIFLHDGEQGKSPQSPTLPLFWVFLVYFIFLLPFTNRRGKETIDWHLWSQLDLSSDFSGFWINHIVNVCCCFSKRWECPGKRD